jgi:hypothetical protein
MSKLITVKSTATDHKVVLWEKHPNHATKDNPEGEVWIAGNGRISKVAKTPNVQRLLTNGALVEASEVKPVAQAVKELVTRKPTEA